MNETVGEGTGQTQSPWIIKSEDIVVVEAVVVEVVLIETGETAEDILE